MPMGLVFLIKSLVKENEKLNGSKSEVQIFFFLIFPFRSRKDEKKVGILDVIIT